MEERAGPAVRLINEGERTGVAWLRRTQRWVGDEMGVDVFEKLFRRSFSADVVADWRGVGEQ